MSFSRQTIDILLIATKGANILKQLLTSPSYTSVYAFTRRDLPDAASSTLHEIKSKETDTWPSLFPKSEKAPADKRVFLTALGTTKAAAGSFEAQRKIDYDLNLALATAAKDSGVDTCVLISSGNASSTSMFNYVKMKGELEESIKGLGFKHTVIVRPGLIMGTRPDHDSRPAEAAIRKLAHGMRAISGGLLTNFWGQDATIIARAAINAGSDCVQGKREAGVWFLEQADIIRMGQVSDPAS